MYADIKADKELFESAGETKNPWSRCGECWNVSITTGAMKKGGVHGESVYINKSSMPGKIAKPSENIIKWLILRL